VAPWWWFPCKPKHVGAASLILKCFNKSTFFNVVCISWTIKCCVFGGFLLLRHDISSPGNRFPTFRRNRLSPFSRPVDTRIMHLIIWKIRKLCKLKCFVQSYKFCRLVLVNKWWKFHLNFFFMHPYDFLVKQSLFCLPIKTRRLKWSVMSHILFG
jgi:hypothetical protein